MQKANWTNWWGNHRKTVESPVAAVTAPRKASMGFRARVREHNTVLLELPRAAGVNISLMDINPSFAVESVQ